jgi:hypothetical protein
MLRRALPLSAILLAACATSGITPARRAEIQAAADAWYPDHRARVQRYEVHRFGQIIAYRWENQRAEDTTQPFLNCVRPRLGLPADTRTMTPTIRP